MASAAILPSPVRRNVVRRLGSASRDRLVMAAVLVAAALFLFLGTAAMPILLWDESRNIVNALEMHREGMSFVTTYGFQPDLWNTKPPLLIWLMSASVALFGPSELALRLPSMIATLGTLTIVMLLTRRVTGSIATAVTAAALLAISPGLFAEHGARTADYDALLLAFATAYLAFGFLAIHRADRGGLLALAAAAVIGAAMTKSVAGLVPLLGIAPYLLATRRFVRMVRDPRVTMAALTSTAALAAFVLAREHALPGYAAAAWHNDIAGRFGSSLIGEAKPAAFYLSNLAAGYLAAIPLLLLAPVALRVAPARDRLLLNYALCIAVTLIGVLSLAASKLSHYLLPAAPWLAIAAAIVLRMMIVQAIALWRRGGIAQGGGFAIGVTVAMLLSATGANGIAYRRIPAWQQDPLTAQQARYRALIAALASDGHRRLLIVEPGFQLEADPHYAATLYAYRLLWAERGVVIEHAITLPAEPQPIVASCDPASMRLLAARGRAFPGTPGCLAVRIAAIH